MKTFSKPLWLAAAVMATALFACVTINIYFPAEKVESVAGDIVDDIRGKKPNPKGDQSLNRENLFQQISIAFLPARAWAQDVVTVSNPTIRALKQKMKSRFQQLKPFYQKGVLHEGAGGFLAAVNTGGLSLKQKRDLNVLVDAENSDRRTLYKEVAKALQIDPGQVNRIAEIFAKEWQKPVR